MNLTSLSGRKSSYNAFKDTDPRLVSALMIFNNLVENTNSEDLEYCRYEALNLFSTLYPSDLPHLLNVFQNMYPHWFRSIKDNLSTKELICLYLEKQHCYGGYKPMRFAVNEGMSSNSGIDFLRRYLQDSFSNSLSSLSLI